MGSDSKAVRCAIAFCTALGAVLSLHAGASADGATPWWSRVGLRGTSLTDVVASGKTLAVRTSAGTVLRSTNAGEDFDAVAEDPSVRAPTVVSAAPFSWTIDASGHVLVRAGRSSAFTVDPGGPALGSGARLIAAPAALPGVVVAVATDGTVWRRGADGDWRRALLLLPQSLVQGAPRITSVAAFSQPLSDTIYIGTDGYAVLDSTNGGDDWIRAGPGLPDSVHALATDDSGHAVYAATSDGLWVHALQSLPSPPAYRDAALVWRWVGIGLVTVVASMLAVLGLVRALPGPPARSPRP